MPGNVSIGQKRVRVGDKVRSTERAAENGICNSGMTFTVHTIRDDEVLIGLYSTRRIKGWGDLDGEVPSRQGFWATRDCLLDNFELISIDHVINDEVVYRGHSLKGMRCKVLHQNRRTNDVFIEVEKNVGGGSADGMGRRGHCIVVGPQQLVKDDNQEKSTEKWIEEDKHA